MAAGTAPLAGETLEQGAGGLPLVQAQGLNTNQGVNFSGFTVDTSGNITAVGTIASGNITVTGTESVSGTFTPTGGVAAAGGFSNSTVFHTGGTGVLATTEANQKQIVTTETYYAEVFIPANTTVTGVSLLNGHTTNGSVNLNVGLANSTGVIVAQSATTTAQGTADTFQQIPFTTPYSAKGPAKYYIAVQGSATTGFIATYAALGNFGANKVTSETYGTFLTTASYATTTYTANLGPIADTY